MRRFLTQLIRWLKGHDWEYPGPFARKCRRCGRHENVYTNSWGGRCWWEAVYPLAHSPRLCRAEPHDADDFPEAHADQEP